VWEIAGRIRTSSCHRPVLAWAPMGEQELLEHAARRHGVISRSEARGFGLTERQIDHRLTRGHWTRVVGGVYRLAGVPASWRSQLVAACLAGSPLAVASHRAAARLWGFPGFDTPAVEVTMEPGRSRRLDGVVVHECALLLDDDRREVDGVPVVGVELNLIQLAAIVGGARIEGLVDDALRRRLTTLDSLRGRLEVLGRSGRDGSGVLRTAIDVRDPGNARAESRLERAFADLITDAQLPAPTLQHEVRDVRGRFIARVDAAWPEARLAVELDGRAFHEPLGRWNRDLRRQNDLVVAGWTPLRFTWWDVDQAPQRVVQDIARVVRAAA